MDADDRTLIRQHAIPLDASRGVEPILDRIADVEVALIGEATHGTAEFYRSRAPDPSSHRVTRFQYCRSGGRLAGRASCRPLGPWPECGTRLCGSARRLHPAPLLERAIGVVDRPRTERQSHYFLADLPRQFDIVIHYDETRGVEPLALWSRRDADLPETWPTGVQNHENSGEAS